MKHTIAEICANLRTEIAAALATCDDTTPEAREAIAPYRAALETWLAGGPLAALPHPDDFRNVPGFSSDPVLVLWNCTYPDDASPDDAIVGLETVRGECKNAEKYGMTFCKYVRLSQRHSEAVRAADWHFTRGEDALGEAANAEKKAIRVELGWA